MLYERNYIKLTEPEKIEIAELKKLAEKREFSAQDLMKFTNIYYQYNSYFPNNFLLSDEIKAKRTESISIKENFNKILDDPGSTERSILNFIAQHRAYELVSSIFSLTDFGHHDSYLFKEFELSSTYIADYLLVGSNSHGYHFIFIEFENPNGQITQSNGELGTVYRKGIKQVEDWDNWLEANFHSLRLIFEKYIKPGDQLPKEFYVLDKTRIHYAVIAGRRSDYNENTYKIRRKYLRRNFIKLLHYDNLLDYYDRLISLRSI